MLIHRCYWTHQRKLCVEVKIASLTNGAGKTGFLPAEDWN
jgi:hypothetical protein